MIEFLFDRDDLSRVLAPQEEAISKEVDALDEDQIHNSSHSDLCQYFVEKYTVDPVRINGGGYPSRLRRHASRCEPARVTLAIS